MKLRTLPVLILLSLCVATRADDDAFPVAELPAAVTAAVEDHLPGAIIASAESDEDDGVPFFDLKVDYKGLRLEVEATPEGRIREIDLNRRFFSIATLAREEVPIALTDLPAKVTDKISNVLPGSEILSAAEDENEGVRFYEVNVKHRDLTLRVDVTEAGELLDIDSRKG